MNRQESKATVRLGTVAVVIALAIGCETPSPNTFSRNYGQRGDLPIDPPGPQSEAEEQCADGGRLWRQYCGSCHNARPLGERPFSNYHVAIAHMRDQAYLTGEEYRQIIMFVRRWQGVGPPTPDVDPSPKRFEFSQPMAELRGEPAPTGAASAPESARGPFQAPQEAPPPAARAAGLPDPLP
jgi:hypothetical protein